METANRKTGFARLTPEQMRAIASKGGKAAHAKGTAHVWTTEEARAAGSKGGRVSGGWNKKQPKLPLEPAEVRFPGEGML